jgi:hypothetical protein
VKWCASGLNEQLNSATSAALWVPQSDADFEWQAEHYKCPFQGILTWLNWSTAVSGSESQYHHTKTRLWMAIADDIMYCSCTKK